MCGIVGLVDARRRRSAEDSAGIVEHMAATLVHRGPDASGVWTDDATGVVLGHRRLSILDLSEHGAQPMQSANGRWVLTFNGEIYDHVELAESLRVAGVQLRGHSDTEVLLEAISLWGLEVTLRRIDGMFALAVWDRHERMLTLARDRMGEKPLHYGTLANGEVVFASDLDAIAAHPAFTARVDLGALALYFRHKYVPSPHTIYEGISKLEPGHTVQIGIDGRVGAPGAYWSLFDVVGRGTTFAGSPEDAVDELERLLRRSVRRRMVADVPVGAFLSGGIDSSTVVAVAQAESSHRVRTFTIGTDHSDYDEAANARAVASHLGTDHTELRVGDADALAVVHQLGAQHAEPFADSSQVPTRLVSELARKDVTVVLSGDGGDELFAGYNRYLWVPAIWSRLDRVPVIARSGFARAAGRVRPSIWDSAAKVLPASRRPRMLGLKVAKVLGVADAHTPEEVYLRLVSHWQEPEKLVLGANEPPTLHTARRLWPRTPSIVEHMAAVDAVTYLPDDVLAKVDRATMSVSLEGRIPLLDRELVEFAFGLPLGMRIRDGQSKWPLRALLERHVPTSMFDRPKSGFGVPIEQWLRGSLRDWAEAHLRGPAVRATLDTKLVESAWADHLSGRANNAYELWDVVLFSVWAEHRGLLR